MFPDLAVKIADDLSTFKTAAENTAGSELLLQKAERMPGNSGYLDLRCFDDPEMAGPSAAAAMQFLSNSDAITFDLRHNGGGSPEMVAFSSAIFLDQAPCT